MKVLLIYPQALNHPDHPMGLLYIAAVLEKAGHNVKVLDPRTNFDERKFVEDVKEFNPDFVGFTCTTPQVSLAIDLAEIVKMSCSAKIVFGGVHPTVMTSELLVDPIIDHVIKGEGEYAFLDLVEGRINDKIIEGKLLQNLDELPFPARHLLSDDWYFSSKIRGVWTKRAVTIMASRGCPYQCIYCSSHLVFGRKVRWRSTDNVIAEIEQLRKDFNIDSIWFADDTFTVDKGWVKELCQKMINKEWKNLLWCCQLRVDTIDEETLTIMKKAGCVQVDIGVESGSPKVLKILKKGTNPEMIKKAFALCKKVGVQSFASMIIGTPGETKEDIDLTEKLVKEIKADYTEYFFATPYPGTELYEIAKEKNLLPDTDYSSWIASKQTDTPSIKSENFTPEELIAIRSRLHNKVIMGNYLTMFKRPSFIWNGGLLALKGIRGLPYGIKRFLKTGKLDNIILGMLDEARGRRK